MRFVHRQSAGWMLALLLVIALGVADARAVRADASDAPAAGDDRGAPYAATIYRDAWGVPHVHGRRDADAAYGFGYAQAEDDLPRLVDNVLRATGRAAEVHGRDLAREDWLNRALEIPRRAQAEYAGAAPDVRALLDGYAAGVMRYVDDHATARALLARVRLERVEPWHPLALIRHLYDQRGFLRAAAYEVDDFEAALQRAFEAAVEAGLAGAVDDGAVDDGTVGNDAIDGAAPEPVAPAALAGSNSWAAMPSRTADGRTFLFINPHLPLFGPSRVYEGHVISDAGWNFSGYTRLGFPLPYVGFSPRLGWASTDNAADLVDVYRERFDDPAQPDRYRVGDAVRDAIAIDATPIRVRQRGGRLAAVPVAIRRTHRGPLVLQAADGAALAVRIAGAEDEGWLAQWYAMTRARDLDQFRAATAPLAVRFGNYLYADADGHVRFVYNAPIPIRDPAVDARRVLDGADPRSDWRGTIAQADLPQVNDPPTGWLQNGNGTPLLSTDPSASGVNPSAERFAALIVEGDNARSRRARQLLAAQPRWTFDAWARATHDTTLVAAAEDLPRLFAAADAAAADADRDAALARLRAWDGRATTDSVATTLFVAWWDRAHRRSPSRRWAFDADGDPLAAFDAARADLRAAWGTWQVPWGEINRVQRPAPRRTLEGLPATGGPRFDDDARSWPAPAAPTWSGASFTLWPHARPLASAQDDGRRPLRHYARGGNSYVAVVAFGRADADGRPPTEARTLHLFGASGNPASPHFDDQIPRAVAGDYKPSPLTLDAVRRAAVRHTALGTPPSARTEDEFPAPSP
ncbi:MAG: penicillin acylase family protein [Acidobacteriota bacterium]